MSRIGIQPVALPGGVSVEIKGSTVSVKGPKGELSWDLPRGIEVKQEESGIQVSRTSEEKEIRALHGTTRSLLANMVEGVNTGYSRELEIQGVGFKAQMRGKTLVLNVGYSHEIAYDGIEGVTIQVPADTQIVVSGPDKQAVGQAAARIRAFCPAEPYKGKGIRYKGEQVRRKAGKTVA